MKRARLGALSLVAAAMVLTVLALVLRHASSSGAVGEADPLAWYWRYASTAVAGRADVANAAPQMRYAKLTPAMDEAALRAHFAGLALDCRPTPVATKTECVAMPMALDGAPALRLVLTLTDGRLSEGRVQVPWWAHSGALRGLLRDLGPAHELGAFEGGDPTIRWVLPSVTVALDRAPGFDPLQSSVLRFVLKN